jgi:hypothetical protein
MTKQRIVDAPCVSCHRDTKHSILHTLTVEREEADRDGYISSYTSDRYDTLQCRGCESVSLRYQLLAGERCFETTYYPPPADRALPSWHHHLPNDLQGLLKEIYGALHADSRRLALMGVRTAIDMALLEKAGDVGSFEDKVKKLENDGFVTTRGREVLDAALEAGHAGIHRGVLLDHEHLISVIDIVEGLLQAVYVLGTQAAELRKATPPRRRKS